MRGWLTTAWLLTLALAGAPLDLHAEGCTRLDDPYQVLDLYLEMEPSDWDIVRRDVTFEIERPGLFRCAGPGASMDEERPVMVRRKHGGALPSDSEPVKVSIKIDFDDPLPDGEWRGHRKLSLENGVRQPFFSLVREGVTWQLMARAGAICGGSAWARLHLNGKLLGVYTRVEQVDKSYLRRRLGEDEGFLYKRDLSVEGGWTRETREGEPDPYEMDLCYEPFDSRCRPPARGLEELLEHLDVPQLLTLGAVNSLIANTDGLLESNNNYFWYNSPRPRVYLPWDLDLGLLEGNVAHGPHVSEVERLLYVVAPSLRGESDQILGRLLGDVFAPAALDALLDGIAGAVGPAIDADPLSGLEGGFPAEMARVRSWLHRRSAHLLRRIPAWRPSPLVINEVLASNLRTNADEEGEAADWVEIHNRGAVPLPLAGLYLSDDPARPLRWPLPPLELPAGGHLLVWCDRDPDQGPLHAGFQLERDGEAIGLYDGSEPLLRVLDFVWFAPQETDVSLGRLPDGTAGLRRLPCPTPGASNRACEEDRSRFVRGDAGGDGRVNVTDAVRLLQALYAGRPLGCRRAADLDDDGRLGLIDAVLLLAYLFEGSEAPGDPFPACGNDPTPDALDCNEHPACKN